MIHLGLVGYPLEHSLSPKIHLPHFGLAVCKATIPYFPFPQMTNKVWKIYLPASAPEKSQGLTSPSRTNRMSSHFWMNLRPQQKPSARSIQYIAAIDKLIGDNTDAPGFLSDLKRFIGNRKSEIGNRKISIGLGRRRFCACSGVCSDK